MCHPKQKALSQSLIDEDPFLYLKIEDTSILDSIDSRRPCTKCCKSRKYFCYTCYVPVQDLQGKLPVVKLPFKIDIIKHKHEIDGKSTAIHASILAEQDVTIYTYPDIPDYDAEDISKTVLIFPSNDALNIEQLFMKQLNSPEFQQPSLATIPKGYNRSTLLKNRICTSNEHKIDPIAYNLDKLPIDRAVFIDSTWHQSKGIYKDDRIKRLQCVALQNRVSQFWRHQKNSPRWYLATIEAIHQFCVEMHINAWGFNKNYYPADRLNSVHSTVLPSGYNGQYDNLLYFFKYMHGKIHLYYNHTDLQAYKRPVL
ncbi:tRNA-uridine aminocarboxypropyltransferase 1 isoform X2 [Chrysoperla carnea]|uniref:tRNA-uridine aminocarboxypropyltransferase 1 isoform X2 n=1 Tax=Chrysoperla carnea TaxID=189513 RepID=UPI001D0744ED|nr:tRNA-uridine aminocarboxypropyltransferase 1 isoform X2 [Chrysoperla carnea]